MRDERNREGGTAAERVLVLEGQTAAVGSQPSDLPAIDYVREDRRYIEGAGLAQGRCWGNVGRNWFTE